MVLYKVISKMTSEKKIESPGNPTTLFDLWKFCNIKLFRRYQER